MSRIKSRQNTDLCADCGATDPTWVSINKGIYLCAECCSVHRSFGRHISQVKSIQKSQWSPTLLSMVQTLNNNGVNNIWEHLLLDQCGKLSKKKPLPKDPLHPTKADFIQAKHLQFAYVFRPSRDDTLCTESELGKQLHSSVRTANLETSLKLLIQGADPNYFHDEKGTTPLHVAAKANQMSQAELLIVYGADPNTPDAKGVHPIEYARLAGNLELADRLAECMYEVTDRLTQYICGKKPDHKLGKHFLLPERIGNSDPTVITKLQRLPTSLFEKLVTDVYDEIDRRETEAVWMSSSDSLELSSVPFLPVDPSFSATRNQGRQKLARFTVPELKQLVTDLLEEIHRRQTSINSDLSKHVSQISDDEPLYDSVASDEDYAIVPQSITNSDEKHSEDKPETSNAELMLTKRLLQSDTLISDLRAEVRVLQSIVEKLNNENLELRTRLSRAPSMSNGESSSTVASTQDHTYTSEQSIKSDLNTSDLRLNKRNQRPTSMYETREGIRTVGWKIMKDQKTDDILGSTLVPQQTYSLYGGTDSSVLESKLVKSTENLTHVIQELWKCIQGPGRNEGCLAGAEKIYNSVIELTKIIPPGSATEEVKVLLNHTSLMQVECIKLHQMAVANEGADLDYYIQKVRSCAYEIAKSTKVLVTRFIRPGRGFDDKPPPN